MNANTNTGPLSFFNNPIWRKFVGREIAVVSLSEPEHRMRDARALMALRAFLPAEESGLTSYLTVTVGASEPPHWPQEGVLKDKGVVLLGRPALFGDEAMWFLAECSPYLAYSFQRNDCPDQQPLTRKSYRTIVARHSETRLFSADLFDEQRRKTPPPRQLKDLGFIYSGWHGTNPVVAFAGSSSVSTWGSVVWSMQQLGALDLRWQQDVQGIIEAWVVNTPRAYQTVDARVHESQLLAPARIWMDGRDLPPSNAWREAMAYGSDGEVDVRILINDEPIFNRLQSYMIPLVMLAWVNSKEHKRTGTIIAATCTSKAVLAWIDAFLGKKNAMGPRQKTQPHVNKILNDAARHAVANGGLARIEVAPTGESRFTLWFRDPPGFLPVFRI